MKQIKKILIIIQRSNGDVFLSSPLINAVYNYYENPQIDLLVNDDTSMIAKTLSNINHIHQFSYKKKKENRISQEKELIGNIFRKYDLSINLTASDRSVLYAILASKNSISAVEKDAKKSWWKNYLLNYSYPFDTTIPIVKNNIQALKFLGIKNKNIEVKSSYPNSAKESILKKLKEKNIDKFIIFHPSAQYDYKIYPRELRDNLLKKLNSLNVPIIITGAVSQVDQRIKLELPNLTNVHDFIGETNLNEYFALSHRCEAYIGMDTLNMHIAASQNKRIFAIFGPTILATWSPWSNDIQANTNINIPKQTYGNITIFQANMSCVACGLAGCDDKHGNSDCLDNIDPDIVFDEVQKWLIK
ncbi:glycosyltransferase family 9 protein [bacterium]|nr:glycosyltransferase family 9 protein [bacterium]